MNKQTSLVMAALSVCLTSAAQTQEAPAKADSLQVNLSEVSVVAQRADAKTPVAFTQLSAEQIARENTARDIPYILEMTPSVVTTSDAGAGVGYTGLRIRGTDGSRINVTANGVPVNDAESNNVYWVNLPDMAGSLRDIQVQRGVGTSTNGAGAFGASINMATDAPSIKPYVHLDGSYGMYNTHKEAIKVSTGLLGGHWSAEARISNIGSDGYIDRASSRLFGYMAQVGFYDASTSVRLLAFGGKERTYMAWDYASLEDMEKYGRRYNPCGKYTDAKGNTAFYPNQYDNYASHNFQLIAKHQFSSELTLDAALHFTKGNGYYEQYKTNRTLIEYGLQPFETVTYDEAGNPVITKVKKSDLVRLKNMDNEFGGGLFNITWKHGPLNLVGGAALNAYMGRHFGQVSWVRNYTGSLDPLQEYYRNYARKLDASAYARANWEIIPGLSAYGDLQWRFVRYSIRGTSDTYDYNIEAPQQLNIFHKYNFFNPKVGLNYVFAQKHRVYASWSVAHKEPVRDNFLDCAPDRQPVPERLFDYELGYTYTSPIWSGGVNFYFMDYKDQLIATGQLSDTGNAVSENVPKSYRMGVELQSVLRPVSWFEWSLNATFSRNKVKDFVEYIYEDEWTNPITINHGTTTIAFSPSIVLGNAFTFNWKGLDATLRTRYVSRQYLNNAQQKEQSLDPYCVSDLILGYTLNKVAFMKSIRFSFAINNLFSAKYFSNGYSGAGYYVDDDGQKVIYRYAGYAAQAPINVLGSISITI